MILGKVDLLSGACELILNVERELVTQVLSQRIYNKVIGDERGYADECCFRLRVSQRISYGQY